MTVSERSQLLDLCDAALADKPRLSEVFTTEWRVEFRNRVLRAGGTEIVSYPATYWLPILSDVLPDQYPPDLQARVENGLDVLWPQFDAPSCSALVKRMQGAESATAEEELLAVAGFAREFGRDAVKAPSANPAASKPEFWLLLDGVEVPVECKALFDNRAVRELNDHAMRTGVGWRAALDPLFDRNRFRRAIVQKIKQMQGGRPGILIVTLYTPWLHPQDAYEAVSSVFANPGELEIPAEGLPLALGWVVGRLVQGVWLHAAACFLAGITADTEERIRKAIVGALALRSDRRLVTEYGWSTQR